MIEDQPQTEFEAIARAVESVKSLSPTDPLRYNLAVLVVGKFLDTLNLIKEGLPDDADLYELITIARKTYLQLVDNSTPRFLSP